MAEDTDIVIAGGGIGGLALALFLHAKGKSVIVLEAAEHFQPVGAGVNILPHALAVLSEIGLAKAIISGGREIEELRFYSVHGQKIYGEARGRYAGNSWPQISIHRATLHEVLYSTFAQRIGLDRLHLGIRVCDFSEDGGGVRVRGSAGEGNDHFFTGEVLVGCDGVHSSIRRCLFPDEGDVIDSGVTMWRGVSKIAPFLGGATMVLAGCLRAGKLVVYPIGEVEKGSQPVNWVLERRTIHRKQMTWSAPSGVADLEWADRDWNLPWLDVNQMLRQAERILVCPMVDRDPLSQWSFGRVTLLGDAAHPMYPFGSNGACQAILDASALSQCLSKYSDSNKALMEYESRRLSATRAVTLLNRTSPPDFILEEVDRLTDGGPFEAIEDVVSPSFMQETMSRYISVTSNRRPRMGTS